MSVNEVEKTLNSESGLKGMSGLSNDVRTLLESSDPRAKFALDYFALKVAQHIALMAVSIGFGIVLGALQLLLGQAVAIAGNALLYGMFMCGLAGSMYFAWKHMLGGEAGLDAAAAPPPSGVAM